MRMTVYQNGALNNLFDALEMCREAGIFLWDSNGSIVAINGIGVEEIGPDPDLGQPLSEEDVDVVWDGKPWAGAFADDPMYYVYKKE